MIYTFADLFAWIWWFHLAFHAIWNECVMACDINEKARLTYEYNFSKISRNMFDNNLFYKDIKLINEKEIPNFDIICWWFPCQPFSQVGRWLWFKDERWNLFFDIARLIKEKRPKAFFLENVRWLEKHDWWNTLLTIHTILTKELWYSFYYKIVKAYEHWLPQNRPRIFMVWFDKSQIIEDAPVFIFPQKKALKYTMSEVFWWKCDRDVWFTLRVGGKGSWINDRRNWDWYLVDGSERRLTPREWKMMMWFPNDFVFPVSDNEAMKQLWNSVAVDAIRDTAACINEYLNKYLSINYKVWLPEINENEVSYMYS